MTEIEQRCAREAVVFCFERIYEMSLPERALTLGLLIIISLFALAMVPMLEANAADDGPWRIEVVDSAEDVGAYTSLALDDLNHPHISYYDSTDKDLKYAYHDGTEWHIETVEVSGNVGEYTSLFLDDDRHPHISYEGHGEVLAYAWHDGTDWHSEVVDDDVSAAMHTSLVLDSASAPHISYYDPDDWDLKYAEYDGAWYVRTIDHEGYVGVGTSLALDAAGDPHISYHEWMDADLKYAWYDGTWHIETVDYDGGLVATSLILDAEGHPHISYHDLTYNAYKMKYAWHDGTRWHIEVVENGGSRYIGAYSSLALDASGQPHIAYADQNADDLKYAWRDGTKWRVETVDSAGRVGTHLSLALDDVGQPHISYYDSTNRDLKYAHLLPSLSLGKRIAPTDGVHNGDAVTCTLSLDGAGLSARLWDPLPAAMEYVPDSVTSPGTYSPTAKAIVWAGTLPTNTSTLIRYQVTISGAEAPSLASPIANTAWLTDTDYDRGLSATGFVNAQRAYLPFIVRGE